MAMKYFPLGDSSDFVRRLRRSIDGNISYRKLFVALVIFTIMFLYSGPKVFRWMFSSETAKGKWQTLFLLSLFYNDEPLLQSP